MGLGNPEEKFEKTFHNAGALLADRIAANKSKPNFKKVTGKRFVAAQRGTVRIVKPTLFMNESGAAAKEALAFYKAKPEELLVLHDDADLPLGTFRIQQGGGSAGHKGIASIISVLGTADFWRARIGIRIPERDVEKRRKAETFVLSTMQRSEEQKLFDAFESIETVLFPTR